MKYKDPEVMKRPQRTCCLGLLFTAFCLAAFQADATAAKRVSEVELAAKGENLHADYAQMLQVLTAQIADDLPKIDLQKQAAFLAARAELAALTAPKEGDTPQAFRAYDAAKAVAEPKALAAAKAILGDVEAFLTSSDLDTKLMKAAILRHGTPSGLAEFAQQGEQEKALLDTLFADDALMRQRMDLHERYLHVLSDIVNSNSYVEAIKRMKNKN